MGEYADPRAAAGSGGLEVADLDASGLRVAIVAGRFNVHVTQPLLDGALKQLHERGLGPESVPVYWVPGAFELPLVAKRLAESGTLDAVICLGAVIRGETAHFEYVSGAAAEGIARATYETGVPVIFGVLTTENERQALDRAGGPAGNKGAEAADTAIEMVELLRRLPSRYPEQSSARESGIPASSERDR